MCIMLCLYKDFLSSCELSTPRTHYYTCFHVFGRCSTIPIPISVQLGDTRIGQKGSIVIARSWAQLNNCGCVCFLTPTTLVYLRLLLS